MSAKTNSVSDSCRPKPSLAARPPLTSRQTAELTAMFKVLANDSRLRLLHALVRAGEMRVADLAEAVGMKVQAVSNQLQRLVDRSILACRRDGTNSYYRILDPCVVSILDHGLCLAEEARDRTGQVSID